MKTSTLIISALLALTGIATANAADYYFANGSNSGSPVYSAFTESSVSGLYYLDASEMTLQSAFKITTQNSWEGTNYGMSGTLSALDNGFSAYSNTIPDITNNITSCKEIWVYIAQTQSWGSEIKINFTNNAFTLFSWAGAAFSDNNGKAFTATGVPGIYVLKYDVAQTVDAEKGFLINLNGNFVKPGSDTNCTNVWADNCTQTTGGGNLLASAGTYYKVYIKRDKGSYHILASTIPASFQATQPTLEESAKNTITVTSAVPGELTAFPTYVKSYDVYRNGTILASAVAPQADGSLAYTDNTLATGKQYSYSVVCNYIDYAGSTETLASAKSDVSSPLTTSVGNVSAQAVAISAMPGAVSITGAKSSTVYDTVGHMVATLAGDGTISLNAGFYIVKADSKTSKIIVK